MEIHGHEDPVYDLKKLNQGSQVILLRHAQTVFNDASAALESLENYTKEEEIKFKSSEEFRDAKLTTHGYKQCATAEPIANMLNVHTVFVSPLRRALQTAHEVFKNHPDFSAINFVILPQLREFLNCTHDIPTNIEEIINQYKMYFDKLDTSLFDDFEDKLHYFLEDLDEDKKILIKEKLQPKEGDTLGSNAFDVIIEIFKESFPIAIESVRSIHNRCKFVQKKIQELLDSGEVADDEKIIVCGHSTFFKVWTNKWDIDIEGTDPLPKPENFVWMKN